jgi:hypothetical protein
MYVALLCNFEHIICLSCISHSHTLFPLICIIPFQTIKTWSLVTKQWKLQAWYLCHKSKVVTCHYECMNILWTFFNASGVGLSPLYCSHFWPIVPAPDDRWEWLWSSWWNEDWQGKPKYSEKTCPNATLSTTNPTWPNPGRRGGKPATNHLSYGMALVLWALIGIISVNDILLDVWLISPLIC